MKYSIIAFWLPVLICLSSCSSKPDFKSLGGIKTINVYCFWGGAISSHGFSEEQIRGYPRGKLTNIQNNDAIISGLEKVIKGKSGSRNQDLSLILDLIGGRDSMTVCIGADHWVDISGSVYGSNIEELQPIYDLLPERCRPGFIMDFDAIE